MASGDQIDMQREKRWPNHTGIKTATPQTNGGVKVNFDAWEEDDFSDQEDVCGPIAKMTETMAEDNLNDEGQAS